MTIATDQQIKSIGMTFKDADADRLTELARALGISRSAAARWAIAAALQVCTSTQARRMRNGQDGARAYAGGERSVE